MWQATKDVPQPMATQGVSASALPVLASPGAGPSSPSAALVDKVRLMEQTCSALNSKLAEMADSEAALEQLGDLLGSPALLAQRSAALQAMSLMLSRS